MGIGRVIYQLFVLSTGTSCVHVMGGSLGLSLQRTNQHSATPRLGGFVNECTHCQQQFLRYVGSKGIMGEGKGIGAGWECLSTGQALKSSPR